MGPLYHAVWKLRDTPEFVIAGMKKEISSCFTIPAFFPLTRAAKIGFRSHPRKIRVDSIGRTMPLAAAALLFTVFASVLPRVSEIRNFAEIRLLKLRQTPRYVDESVLHALVILC